MPPQKAEIRFTTAKARIPLSRFAPTKKSNPCPVCGDTSGKCRTTEGDLVLCMTLESAAGWRSLGATKDGTWFKFVPDSGETSPQQREQQRRDREAIKAERAALERQRRADAMPAELRDRHYRRLLDQLSLHPSDRADLEKRGFSAEAIRSIGFRSVDQWQRLDFELPHSLPGVSLDGRSLNASTPGYLCPIRDAVGLIAGFQVRAREASDGGKYRWLSSNTKKRPDGPTPHSAEFGELPLSVYPGGAGVALVEGTGPKPALAAERLNTNVIGAAGGQWAASPETLKDAIAKLGGGIISLYLDAGDTGKPQVMRRWLGIVELLERWGHEVRVWIPEGDRDIDEVATAEDLKLVPAAELKKYRAKRNKPRGFGAIKLPSDRTATLRAIGRMAENAIASQQPARAAATGPDTDCSAIVLWKPPIDPIGRLAVTAETVPGFGEWVELGRPRLQIEGDPVPVLLKLTEQGFEHVLLDDAVGGGKTHTIGEFLKAWQDEQSWRSQGERKRAIYYASDYRNPTTPTLEAIPETPTGGALNFDPDHLTPSGKPHRKRAPKGAKNSDIAALCVEDDNVQAARAKGVDLYRGSDSPLCNNCSIGTQNCPYLAAVGKLEPETALRSHLSKGGAGAVAFVDEAGQNIKSVRTVTAQAKELAGEIGWIATYKPDVLAQIGPIATLFKQGIDRAIAECDPRFGMVHADVVKYLPTREQVEAIFWDTNGDRLLAAGVDAWDMPSPESIANSLLGLLQPDPESLLKGQSMEGKAQQIENEMTPAILPRLIKMAMGGRGDVAIASSGLITFSYRDRRHQKTLSRFETVFLSDATPDPIDLARRLGIRAEDLTRVSWTSPTFENLTIKIVDGIGKATQQRRNEGQYSEQQRITRLVEAIAANGKLTGVLDLKAHMGSYDDIPVIRGHQFAHSRGSNEYRECDQMVIIAGNATQNLGSALAEWHAITGQSATVKNASPAFWAWVEGRSRANLIQANGRPRAQHRPGDAITSFVVGDLSEADIEALKSYFTGCKIERVAAYDICPQSATRGYQSDRAICEAMFAATARGEEATITQIASELGMTKGAISKRISAMAGNPDYKRFRAGFQTLYKAINSERKPADLDEHTLWIASEFLPNQAQALRDRQISAEAAADVILLTIDSLGDEAANVLSACDSATLATLIGALISSLPSNDRLELLGWRSRLIELEAAQ
ncbi:MAG: hypothetical protein HC857_01160 [Synechococcales cyanobacterium RU_4_20]|nr:hypothetical protein [Synechococcales cyanobacterium RU_4_20]NJR71139.1 hypothetical protein [Synechococcales cyanobacterium CRU_2_2]